CRRIGHGAARAIARLAYERIGKAAALRRRLRTAPRHQPSETRSDERDRNRIILYLAAQVAQEIARAAVARVVHHLVDHLPGRDASPQLVQSRGDALAGRFGFTLKLLAGGHLAVSSVARRRSCRAGAGELFFRERG